MTSIPTYTISWEQRISLTRGNNMSFSGDYATVKYLWKTLFQTPAPLDRRNVKVTVQKSARHKVKEFDPYGTWPRMDFMGLNKLLFPS